MELKVPDFDDSIKSLSPGEWCLIRISSQECFVGFVNPLIDEKFSCAQILNKISPELISSFSPDEYIKLKLFEAVKKRGRIKGYEKNSRIFYGMNDGLPGLIIDQFENASIIQINTAGIDRYRELIKETISALMATPAYLLDNAKYREKEFLPTFPVEALPELSVLENNLHFKIRPEVLQKVGFYYDHRENRLQLMSFIQRLARNPINGIDLFCYAGAWGLSALKAGLESVQFIDQGDFAIEVEDGLKLNGFNNNSKFHRMDVFRFLDESIQKNAKFDVALCDPPAFAKSVLQKAQALEGYTKLHRKVFKVLNENSFVAFSSCTHYVDHEEFQKNIADAAAKENKKIQLVYSGIQGLDHPIVSLSDRSSYIKSYFYIVE